MVDEDRAASLVVDQEVSVRVDVRPQGLRSLYLQDVSVLTVTFILRLRTVLFNASSPYNFGLGSLHALFDHYLLNLLFLH